MFSWGVLHHTPDTQKAVDELYRCLKPQKGKAIIMLYNKHSFYNFKIAIAGLKSILISTFGLKLLLSVKRLVLPWKWFKKSRTELTEWEKLNGAQLLAACSDGFGNPLSKVYSRRDALNMFSKFRNINIQAYESTNNRFIFKVSKAIERYFGWFMVIKAEK